MELLVFLLPASREQCPHTGFSAKCAMTLLQSVTLSLNALAAVPVSLPVLTARMLCCSRTHRHRGIGPDLVCLDQGTTVCCAERGLCFNSVIIR